MSRKVIGLYHNQEPLVGFTKVRCKCGKDTTDTIATLEIPIGANIIRGRDYDIFGRPASKLRTDNAKVTSIEYLEIFKNFHNCRCYSRDNDSLEHKKGKILNEKLSKRN